MRDHRGERSVPAPAPALSNCVPGGNDRSHASRRSWCLARTKSVRGRTRSRDGISDRRHCAGSAPTRRRTAGSRSPPAPHPPCAHPSPPAPGIAAAPPPRPGCSRSRCPHHFKNSSIDRPPIGARSRTRGAGEQGNCLADRARAHHQHRIAQADLACQHRLTPTPAAGSGRRVGGPPARSPDRQAVFLPPAAVTEPGDPAVAGQPDGTAPEAIGVSSPRATGARATRPPPASPSPCVPAASVTPGPAAAIRPANSCPITTGRCGTMKP